MKLLDYINNDVCIQCRSMMLSGNMDTRAAQHTVEVCTSLDLYMERSDTLHNIWDYACTKTLVEGLELLYCSTDDLFTASLLSTDGFQEDLESKLAYLKLESDLRCRRCCPDKHLAEKIAKLPKRIQDKWGLETMFDKLSLRQC